MDLKFFMFWLQILYESFRSSKQVFYNCIFDERPKNAPVLSF